MADVLIGGAPMTGAEYRGHLDYLTGEGRMVPRELAAELGLDPIDLSPWSVKGCAGPVAAYLRLAVRLKRAGLPWRHDEVPIRFTESGMELGKPGELI